MLKLAKNIIEPKIKYCKIIRVTLNYKKKGKNYYFFYKSNQLPFLCKFLKTKSFIKYLFKTFFIKALNFQLKFYYSFFSLKFPFNLALNLALIVHLKRFSSIFCNKTLKKQIFYNQIQPQKLLFIQKTTFIS